MAEDRDERRRDDTIEGAQRQEALASHAEGVAPDGPRAADGPRGDLRPVGPRHREHDGMGAKARDEPSGSVSVMNLVVSGALGLLFGLAGAWAYDAFLGGSSADGAARAPVDQDAQPVADGDGRAAGMEAGEMASRVDQLAQEVDRLDDLAGSRVDPARVEEMQSRLSDIATRLEAVEAASRGDEGLAEQLQERSERIDAMSGRLDEVESRLTTRADRVGGATVGADPGREPGDGESDGDAGPPGAPPRADQSGPGDDAAAEPIMERGVSLFNSDDFEAAQETFVGLLEARPDDARVWYYAALASGKATGNWTGEAERLVLQGVERERAGTPPKAAIDAAFGELSERQGSDWLRYYRRRAGE